MPDYNELQMTLEDIDRVFDKSGGLNIPLIKEAVRQAELKTQDEHERKLRIDTRVYTMLKVWLSSIGIISAAIASCYFKYNSLLAIAIFILMIATTHLFQALKSRPYISMGTFPCDWLFEQYIENHEADGHNEHHLSLVLARLLHATDSILKVSHNSNETRVRLLNRALTIGQYAFLPIALMLLIEVANLHRFFVVLQS